MKDSADPQVIPVTDKLPPVGERVMVVCQGFRCLGFLDNDTIWRDLTRRTELQNVTGWYALDS